MKVKKLEIIKIKNNGKKLRKSFPNPTYFIEGFFLIKLITNEHVSGLGELNPYCGSTAEIRKILKLIFYEIKNKNIKSINLQKMHNFIEKKFKNNVCVNSCIAAISQSLVDIDGKNKKKEASTLFNKSKYRSQQILAYASGGMIFENQDLNILIEEALSCKSQNFFGWKFSSWVIYSKTNF